MIVKIHFITMIMIMSIMSAILLDTRKVNSAFRMSWGQFVATMYFIVSTLAFVAVSLYVLLTFLRPDA